MIDNHITSMLLSEICVGRSWTATKGFGTPDTVEHDPNVVGIFGDYTRYLYTGSGSYANILVLVGSLY